MVICHIFSSSVATLIFFHVFAITGSLFMWFSVGILWETFLKLADHSTITSFISLYCFRTCTLMCARCFKKCSLWYLELEFFVAFFKSFSYNITSLVVPRISERAFAVLVDGKKYSDNFGFLARGSPVSFCTVSISCCGSGIR